VASTRRTDNAARQARRPNRFMRCAPRKGYGPL
jgi:hypothetical protein